MRSPSALILTARYGSGHLQAANVIARELNKKGFEPVVSDLFGESYPFISNITQSILIKSFSHGPYFYKWFYYGTNKLNSKRLSQFSRYLGRNRLQELINEYLPYFVISTFPLHSVPFLIKKFGFFIPTYTVITDYCIHPYWVNPLITHYFVGSETVKNTLLKQNIKEERITVSGIPIRPEFEMSIDKQVVYQKYKLSPFNKVITLFAGAHGVLKNMKELCQLLLKNPEYQVVAICGYSNTLYERLQPLTLQFPMSLRLFRYVEEIHEIFAVSHCLITKPGGITVTEAVSLQLPLILYHPVPGQEAENAAYFAEKGAAFVSHSLIETLEHIKKISQDEELVLRMKKQLKNIHTTQSATIITDHAISQIKQPALIIR